MRPRGDAFTVMPEERAREWAVRDHAACPVPSCLSPAGHACRYGPKVHGVISHTARYLLAADAGLVPALPGRRPAPPLAMASAWRERMLARLTA